jgi:hypothetical protein
VGPRVLAGQLGDDLPTVSFDLHPMDVHNLCFVLRRHKEKRGPRSLRYMPEAGPAGRGGVRAVASRWCFPRSPYLGDKEHEIRVWGRRRLLHPRAADPAGQPLHRPPARPGLPSFYVADLGHMNFTLGLSGWTANDWASAGNFDLMAPRAEVDDFTKRRVFAGLKETWFDTPDRLATRLGVSRAAVLGALGAWSQAGRAMFDLAKGVYRVRELTREPLPMAQLRFANPREEAADRLRSGRMTSSARPTSDGGLELSGTVEDGRHRHEVSLTIDADQRMTRGQCDCNFFQQNKLFKGPCEHLLALRFHHARQAQRGQAPRAGAGR